MKKDQLILAHVALVKVRALLEERGLVPRGTFDSYDALGVSPVMLHRDRRSHAFAIIELAVCLDDCSDAPKLRAQLERAKRPRELRL